MESKNEEKNGKTHCYFCSGNQKLKYTFLFLNMEFFYDTTGNIHWEAGNFLWELSTAVCSRLSLDEYGSSLATA